MPDPYGTYSAFRRVVLGAVLALAACGDPEPPPVKLSDADLAKQVREQDGTRTAAKAYLDCLGRVAPTTPNGREALDLARIDVVLAACQSDHDAVRVAIDKSWPGDAENERRLRGLKDVAITEIRAHPFEPKTITIK